MKIKYTMKVHKSSDHYSPKEQAALQAIKNKIVDQLHPLIIYALTTVSSAEAEYSCFTRARQIETWHFQCDLLIVLPNGRIVSEETKKQVEESTAAFGKVTMFIHHLGFILREIEKGCPFFCTMRRSADVLYEINDAAKRLPLPLVKSSSNGNRPPRIHHS